MTGSYISVHGGRKQYIIAWDGDGSKCVEVAVYLSDRQALRTVHYIVTSLVG